jgi:hypothetical protein
MRRESRLATRSLTFPSHDALVDFKREWNVGLGSRTTIIMVRLLACQRKNSPSAVDTADEPTSDYGSDLDSEAENIVEELLLRLPIRPPPGHISGGQGFKQDSQIAKDVHGSTCQERHAGDNPIPQPYPSLPSAEGPVKAESDLGEANGESTVNLLGI